ncbi:MAG: hypothetical protein J7M30_05300, partial [Deltaproteobacteria bacterium]|nr:hypothetical protein [Deltaproteobacteria bacterium]
VGSNVGGAMAATAVAGALNINGGITATNGFAATSGGNTNLNANVTTTGGNVQFNSTTVLGVDVAVSTGGGAGGNITFAGTLDGTRDLDLTAGTGDVTFTGAVGGGTALRDLIVNSAGALTAAAISAALIDITGNTAVNLNGNVNATNTFTSRGGAFTLPAGITINTNNTDLLIANTGNVTVAGILNAGLFGRAGFGNGLSHEAGGSANISGGGTVNANTIYIGGNTVGSSPGLHLNPASANDCWFNLTGDPFSGWVTATFSAGSISLDNIHTAGTLQINSTIFGAHQVDFGSMLTLSTQQEKIEKLLRAAATAEFFMKAPLWIDIMMEEDEEEECDPDDEECLERKRARETSWLAPDYLRPSSIGIFMPTLLYEETEDGDLVIQLSSLR